MILALPLIREGRRLDQLVLRLEEAVVHGLALAVEVRQVRVLIWHGCIDTPVHSAALLRAVLLLPCDLVQKGTWLARDDRSRNLGLGVRKLLLLWYLLHVVGDGLALKERALDRAGLAAGAEQRSLSVLVTLTKLCCDWQYGQVPRWGNLLAPFRYKTSLFLGRSSLLRGPG